MTIPTATVWQPEDWLCDKRSTDCWAHWDFLRMNIYEWFGRYTNELGLGFFKNIPMNLKNIRMNWGSIFLRGKIYEWIGKYWGSIFFEGEDIRMNWKTYEWIEVWFFGRGKIIGSHTNELGFIFFERENIRMNWQTYEWIGVQIFRAEDIRMNWKTYEWIGVAGRLAGRGCLSLCDNGWQAKSSLCDNLRTDYMTS